MSKREQMNTNKSVDNAVVQLQMLLDMCMSNRSAKSGLFDEAVKRKDLRCAAQSLGHLEAIDLFVDRLRYVLKQLEEATTERLDEKYAIKLNECNSGDIEADHGKADGLLVALLYEAGFHKTADEFELVEKWYA